LKNTEIPLFGLAGQYCEFKYLWSSISIANILIFPISVRDYQSASGGCDSYPAVSMTNESVLSCPNGCGRRYTLYSSLWKHLRYVCGVEKRFRCTVCTRMFTFKHDLHRHMLTHQILPWNNCGMCVNHLCSVFPKRPKCQIKHFELVAPSFQYNVSYYISTCVASFDHVSFSRKQQLKILRKGKEFRLGSVNSMLMWLQ